jgi:hypothetical protein
MKRPVMVTIIGVLAIIGGIAQAIFGGALLALRNDETLLKDTELTSSQVTTIGVVCLIVGVLAVIFAVGLLKGSRISRTLVGITEVAQIAASVYAIVQLSSGHRAAAIGNIVGAVIVLYFLFGTQKAKEFFA